MTEREKVIKGLLCIKGDYIPCASCKYANADGYGRGDRCKRQCASDALALLKEQEDVPVDTKKQVLADRQCEVSPHHYERKGFCPKCHQEIKLGWNRNYCGFCGQAVKWND